MEETNVLQKKVSLKYLFMTFFKIGCVSFGGHMALIAVVKEEMVERDKTISQENLLNALSIASLLPGPLAVNVVSYIGYHLKNKVGLFVSMLGILLPACTLMFVLSWCYFNLIHIRDLSGLMAYTVAAVSAIIITTGLNIFFKEVRGHNSKIALCLISIVLIYLFNGYLVVLLTILIGGVIGIYFNLAHVNDRRDAKFTWGKLGMGVKIGLASLSLLYTLFVSELYKYTDIILLRITAVFSGISLSLFGGGYVMIPIMQSLFVTELKWLTNQEFIDSIAFSQLTPGPILVSAFFTGYKLAGFAGAILATIAIFVPSAVLMIIVSKIFKNNIDSTVMKNALAGIKPVVVGMIIASGIKLFFSVDATPINIALFLVAFILSFKFKFNPVYLIIISLIMGTIMHFMR